MKAIKIEQLIMKKYDYVCEECGGELKVDAWVVWSVDKQDFITDNVFVDQDRWCCECDTFTEIKEVEVE